MVNQCTTSEWVLRREPRLALVLSRCVSTTSWGVPALVAEVVLFYKSLDLRPHDVADFRALSPALTLDQVSWLREAIGGAQPEHPWLSDLHAERATLQE